MNETAGRGGLPAGPEMLRRGRVAVGYSQERLGAASGLSARTIRNLETGRTPHPRQASLDDLALALGMTGHEREAFLQGWGLTVRGVRVDLQHLLSTTQHDRLLDSTRDLLEELTTAYVCMHSFVDDTRRVVHEEQDRVVTAGRNGIRVLPLIVDLHALGPSGRARVSALGSCRIGRKAAVPTERADVYEVHLGRELRKGESWQLRIGIDYLGSPTTKPEDVDEVSLAMFAVRHVDAVAVVRVSFCVSDLPSRCWTVSQDRLGSGLVDGRSVEVSPDGHAQYVVRQPTLGWHGLRWSW